MQKLYSIASLSFIWLVLANFGSELPFKNSNDHLQQVDDEVSVALAETPLLLLGCQDTIIVSLDANCQFSLTPEVLVAGDIPICLIESDFQILVDDPAPANGSIVDECGVWKYYLGLSNPDACISFEPCWGYIQAEDKTAPIITVPEDVHLDLSCINLDTIFNNKSSLAITGVAQVEDNCSFGLKPLEDFTDVLVQQEACSDIIIQRTFSAEDEKGNFTSKTQKIYLHRPGLAELQIAETTFKYDHDCDAQNPYKVDVDGHLHPDISGYPFFINVFGDSIFLDKDICGMAATYVDTPFEVCESTQKIERKWVISDWCTGTTRNFDQLIIVGDLTPPELTFDKDLYDFSTGPYGCQGSIQIVNPEIYEKCSSTTTQVELYRVELRPFTSVKDTNFVTALPLSAAYFDNQPQGDYLLVYLTMDACKNLVKDTIRATISDKVKPIARCIDQLNVSLDNYGFAKATTRDINEGSSDNCQLDSLQVRRLYTQADDCTDLTEDYHSEWSDEVYFNCCDLNGEVTVELKAKDKAGNQSICWMNVKVEDKSVPECVPPPSVVIDCDSLPRGFDFTDLTELPKYFGTAKGIDFCLATTVIELTPEVNLSQCGYGEVIRKFEVQDEAGKVSIEVCEQVIEVNPVHNYEIKFPEDHITVCALPDPDSLETQTWGCDLLAVSSVDSKHTTAADECYKIFRKFRVINWCEYDGDSEPYIIPRDVDCDGVPGDEDVYLLVRPDGTVYLDANNNELDSIPVRNKDYDCFDQEGNPYGYWTSTDSFPPLISNGFWEYTQIIKVIDTIAPTIFVEDSIFVCINDDNCVAEAAVSFAIIDECVDGDVVIRTYVEDLKNEYQEYSEDPWNLVGRYPKYLMTGVVPEGSYRVEIQASDQCGNVTKVKYHLEVVDCKAPGLVCRDGLVVELMPQEPGTDVDGDGDFDAGANTIWVSDLIASPVEDDCTGPVSYSINRKGETPDPDRKQLILTCEDQETVTIEVYAWDSANNPTSVQPDGSLGGPNYDNCTTFIYVQDNANNFCDPQGGIDIAGVIQTPTGESMGNVEVVLSGADSKVASTRTDGQFHITGLREGYDYTIFPRKRDELLKGVSTLDIIYMTKHILGVEPLSLDLQLLAADINRSGSISTYDVILLRKAILNIDPDASQLAGWQFVDARRTTFENTGNPWAKPIYPSISLNNIDFPRGDLDFIGIKMGDVSGLRGLRSAENEAPQFIVLDDFFVEKGTEVRLPIVLPDPAWEGLQLGLQWTGATNNQVQIRSSVLDESQYRLSAKDGTFLLTWDKYTGEKPQGKAPLFELVWEAKQSGSLSEQVQLLQRNFLNEAYLGGKAAPLQLYWKKRDKTLSNIQVYPNPFTSFIRVQLDQASIQNNADLKIDLLDLHGRVIQNYEVPSDQRVSGVVSLSLNTNLTAGIYLLRVVQGDQQAHFRLVKGE